MTPLYYFEKQIYKSRNARIKSAQITIVLDMYSNKNIINKNTNKKNKKNTKNTLQNSLIILQLINAKIRIIGS